jgi:hypothetical protein
MARMFVGWLRGAQRWAHQGRHHWYVMPVAGSVQQAATVEALLVEMRLRLRYGDPAAAQLVSELLQAVKGGDNAAYWASVDLFAVFDVDATVEAMGRRARLPWAGHVEFLRNLLVLVPIVVTWFSLSLAVGAYEHDIALNHAESALPFLYLWQTRFRGQSIPNFHEVAAVDAALVALLIALTALHRWLTVAAGSEGRDRALVRHALTGAALALIDHRTDREPVLHRLVEQAGQLLVDMEEERRLLIGLVKQVDTERKELATGLARVVETLGQGSSDMLAWSRELRQVHGHVNSRFDETARRADAIAASQEAAGAQLAQMQVELGAAAGRHEVATLAATEAAASLRESSAQVSGTAISLNGTAQGLGPTAAAMDVAAARTVGAADTAAAAADAAAGAATQASRSASDAATAARDAAAAAERLAAGQDSGRAWRPTHEGQQSTPWRDATAPPPTPPGGDGIPFSSGTADGPVPRGPGPGTSNTRHPDGSASRAGGERPPPGWPVTPPPAGAGPPVQAPPSPNAGRPAPDDDTWGRARGADPQWWGGVPPPSPQRDSWLGGTVRRVFGRRPR